MGPVGGSMGRRETPRKPRGWGEVALNEMLEDEKTLNQF